MNHSCCCVRTAEPARVFACAWRERIRNAVLRGETKLEGHSNYLTGNDRSQWRTNVPHFGKVRYTDVYPGIDLVYYGKEGLLEYDFVVAPGANPGRIRFRMDGARNMKLSPEGDLVLTLNNGETRHRKPIIYQDGAEGRTQIAGGYSIRGNQVSFKLGEYDRTRPLVIDPVLSWSGYIGGASADTGTAVAVDSQGNAYFTGQTQSLTGFPTTNGFQTSHGGVPLCTQTRSSQSSMQPETQSCIQPISAAMNSISPSRSR